LNLEPRSVNRPAVLVTGLGFITPIGNDRATVTASLRAGRHGLAPIEFGRNTAVKVAAPVRDFCVNSPQYREWTWPARYDIPRETLRGLAPHGVYALCAIEQALADAGLAPADLTDGATGLFCASAGSAMLLHHYIAQMYANNFERGHPMGVVSSIAGTLNFNLAAHYKITGAVCGFASACASSSHALGWALDEIQLGRQERMIVVGAEELNAETLLPFAAMRVLSPNAAARPSTPRSPAGARPPTATASPPRIPKAPDCAKPSAARSPPPPWRRRTSITSTPTPPPRQSATTPKRSRCARSSPTPAPGRA
jgi:3-oxoacyl-(acyl-carrier-protein) synthase